MNGSRSPARRRLRLAALVVAVIGVLALAAAAFVLSYPGARDTALAAGVTKDLARIYPALFDAVLVVACAAALALHGVLRACAWLAILVITGVIAAADATHAMALTLPKHPMEATVAVVPWAVLLIGFSLLYAIARQARPAKSPAPGPAAPSARPATDNGVLPAGKAVPLSELLKANPGPERAAGVTATPTDPAQAEAADGGPAKAGGAGPAGTAAGNGPAGTAAPDPPPDPPPPLPRRRSVPPDDPIDADPESPEPLVHFNRLRSSPIPPSDEI